MPRRLALLAGLVVAALLAGCAQIPGTGPVTAGRAGDPDPREGIYQVIAEGPRRDADPQDLVRGFIRASAGFGDDHAVARLFITDSSRLSWRPDARISVFEDEKDLDVAAAARTEAGEEPVDAADGDTLEVTAKVPVGIEVDGDGRYTVTEPGETRTERFTLVKVEGQWRIDAPEDGILIAAPAFEATFRPFAVYFPDPTGAYLIPDVHWFAAARDQPGSPELPTALVRALLQGPPDWLEGAVVSGFPAGTSLALGAVVVSDEVASVDLSPAALDATGLQRQMLDGQLRATLGQLRTITSVTTTVNQVEFETGGETQSDTDPSRTPTRPGLRIDPQVGDQALVVDKGRLSWLTGRSTEPVADLAGLRLDGVNRPAASADLSTYAALDGARDRLLMQTQGADDAVEAARGKLLVAPSFDPQGWVWTGPEENAGKLSAARTGADPVTVDAPWLKDRRLVSIRLSRDGARALVGLEAEGKGHVFVAGVVRDPDGRPTTLTQPDGLIPDLSQVVDAAWVDEDQVAVLGTRQGMGDQVWVAQIGGPVTGRGGVGGGQSVTAGDGESSLSVGAEGGTYSYLQGWKKATAARWPAYPG